VCVCVCVCVPKKEKKVIKVEKNVNFGRMSNEVLIEKTSLDYL